MRSVGIRKLKSRLREYVRLAASGRTILVTDRGRAVAELAPPGLASSGPPPRPEPVAPLNEVLAELDENRRDR